MQPGLRYGSRVLGLTTLATAVGLLITTTLTTPDKLGPFGITLWFTGLLICLGGLLSLLIYRTGRLFSKKAVPSLQLTEAMRRGFLTATWLVALVALNSLRQLGVKDIVLITVLVLVINFYLKRLRLAQSI